MKYVTITDIAEELGISKSTVSRALNGDNKNVSPVTRERIARTAAAMGYIRNEAAVNLRSKSNRIVGILVPEVLTPFSMSFVSETQKILAAEGFGVRVAFSNEDPSLERMNLEMFDRARMDGILISACHNSANIDAYAECLVHKIPLVFFDRTIDGLDVSMVCSNDYIKAFFLVEHLIRSGRRQILHIKGPSYIKNARERANGYRDALEKFHLPMEKDMIVHSGVDVEESARVMMRVLRSGKRPDAVFCFTETQAIGAKRAIQEFGLDIPGDVAIATMSGTLLSTLVHPQITAVEQQVTEMATEASRMILDKIADFNTPSRSTVLDAKIVERASTSPVI